MDDIVEDIESKCAQTFVILQLNRGEAGALVLRY